MRKQLISAGCVLAFACIDPAASQAALIAYEGFAYDVGSTNGANGGSGWDAAWTAPTSHTIAAGSRPYSDGTLDLATSGNQSRISNNSGSTSAGAAFRPLDSAVSLSEANPELWLAYVAVADSTTGGHAGVALFNTTTEVGTFGKRGAGNPTWGISIVSGGASVNGTVPATTESFLVYKFTWTGAATPANVELWVSPDLDSTPDSATRDVSSTINNFTFNRVRLSTSTNSGNFDEIRIGTTFADVAPVPEPASLALLAAGAGMLLARRRRQRA
jgi:hypothetical protein